jgi:predicted nuclease with TOPRIM domain
MEAVGLEPWHEEVIVADSSLDEQMNEVAMYRDTIHKIEAENRKLQEHIDALNKKYHSKNRARDTLFAELADSSPEVKDEVIGLIIKNFISSTSSSKRYENLKVHSRLSTTGLQTVSLSR